MFAFLTGTIQHIGPDFLELEVNGLGYQVFCPTNLLSKLSHQSNQKITLYIFSYVREDQFTLYGFAQRSDKHLFQSLLKVSGVGPKLALKIMSQADSQQITAAISQAEVEFFTLVPGIGKKAAQKIIVELKSKLGDLVELDLAASQQQEELITALTSLGYSRQEAVQAINQLPSQITTQEDQLKYLLQQLGRNA